MPRTVAIRVVHDTLAIRRPDYVEFFTVAGCHSECGAFLFRRGRENLSVCGERYLLAVGRKRQFAELIRQRHVLHGRSYWRPAPRNGDLFGFSSGSVDLPDSKIALER